MPDYLPRRDADLSQWTANLAARVATAPEAFKLSAEQAADYVALQQTFADAYRRTVTNATDSTSATAIKNDLRRSLVDMTRKIVRPLRAWPETAPMLANLGLRSRKSPTRIAPPSSLPNVHVVELRGRFATIALRDPDLPSRRGMPRGVRFASIFTCITDGEIPTASAGWRLLLSTSRARQQIVLPHDPTKTSVWVCARWINARGEAGHASAPVDVSGWHKVMRMPQLPMRRAA